MPTPTLLLDYYRKSLSTQFMEVLDNFWRCANDRGTKPDDFTDKILNHLKTVISLGLDYVDLPGINLVNTALEMAIDWMNDKRKEGFNDFIKGQYLTFDLEKIQVLIDQTALRAAAAYQYRITELFNDESYEQVDKLSTIQAERILHYVLSNRLPFNEVNMMLGIALGNSGKGKSGFRNNRVEESKDGGSARATVEGMSRRFAIMIPTTHQCYVKKALSKKITNNQSNTPIIPNKTITHFKEGVRLPIEIPKYGYLFWPQWVAKALEYTPQAANTIDPTEKAKYTDYKPYIQYITKQDLINYINENKITKISLKEYIAKKYINPNIQILLFVADEPAGYDLTALNFENTDLSGTVLDSCKFSGSLNNSVWEDASLIGADFSKITSAVNANFSKAKMMYLQASGANLSNANLNLADLSHANLSQATLKNIQRVGTVWQGSNTTELVTEDSTTLNKILDTQKTQEQEFTDQKKKIAELQIKAGEHNKLIESISNKLEALKNNQTLNSNMVSDLEEIFEKLISKDRFHKTFQQIINEELKHLGNNAQAIQENLKEHEAFKENFKKLEVLCSEIQTQTSQEISKKITHLKSEIDKKIHGLETNIKNVVDQLNQIKNELAQFKAELANQKQQASRLNQSQEEMNKNLITQKEQQNILRLQVVSLQNQITQLTNAAPPDPYRINYSELIIDKKIQSTHKTTIYLGTFKDKPVLIKWFNDPADATIAKRFQQELSIMKKVVHPNLIQYHGVCYDRRVLCIVMEYYPSESLESYLQKNNQNLSVVERIKLVIEICEAVKTLHTHKILHRNLTPRNILINNKNMVKLIDFHFSKQISDNNNDSLIYSVRPDEEASNDHWLSPETKRISPIYKEESDIFSVGKLMELIFSILPKDIKMPKEVTKIITACLKSEFEDRPSVYELLNALKIELNFQIAIEYERQKTYPAAFLEYSKLIKTTENNSKNSARVKAYMATLFFQGRANSANISKDKALDYLLTAAQEGNGKAMYALGQLYKSGKNIPQDLHKACYWFKEAWDHRIPEAKLEYETLARQLSVQPPQ